MIGFYAPDLDVAILVDDLKILLKTLWLVLAQDGAI